MRDSDEKLLNVCPDFSTLLFVNEGTSGTCPLCSRPEPVRLVLVGRRGREVKLYTYVIPKAATMGSLNAIPDATIMDSSNVS